MDNLVYWIWLSLACTPDSTTFSKLIAKYDDAKDIYNATDREIRSIVGAKVSDCSALADKSLDKANEIYKFCTEKSVGILTYQNENFPVALRNIPTPPVLLYYRGKLPDFNTGFRCAIVGTRSLSDYGRKNAFKLGYDMGCAGATVVSGMAIGIDGVAMAGAIASGASTVAVIGSGIDVCYPSVHLTLARTIVKNGCVLTEYAPGTKPEKFNFPRRNRIISGLCPVTVIVEGKESSGSMITARHAKVQGREVFAFPGNVGTDARIVERHCTTPAFAVVQNAVA
jgi:DNA processing protein